MFSAFLTPVQVDTSTLAVDVISAVGHGGPFFRATSHARALRDRVYQPLLSDWRNFETWREAGSKDATTRASEIAREAVDAWQEPSLEPSNHEALLSFVAKRTEEGGAPVN